MKMSFLTPSTRWKRTCLTLGGAVLVLSAGCSRTFWRNQADRDSYSAITETLNDPRWAVPRIDVNADPRSRFFDPYDPDKEPLPPDDGAAGVYMNWVDGWQGYKGWHKFGDTLTVENPQWLANFGWSTDNIDPLTGEIVPPLPELKDVTLPEAVELAQINNRDYQFEIENVYLAALAVTFQRFQFGVRYLNANGVEPTSYGTLTGVPHGPGDNFGAGVAGGVSQLLPAGTQWAVEFANNTLWLFSGGNQTQTVSNLSFSIVQPLLFGAGRKVGLEGLTQSERNLLYEARVLARLRQEIFTDVVGGAPGYLSLLQQMQVIRNLRGNIGQLEDQVERLLAQASQGKLINNVELISWPDGEFSPMKLPLELRDHLSYDAESRRLRWRSKLEITDRQVQLLQNLSDDPVFQLAVRELTSSLQSNVATLDVLKLQSSLASNIVSLRNQELGLQRDLDNYKILLGLRTDTKMTIDDQMLGQFEIIDRRVSTLEQQTKDFVLRYGSIPDDPLTVEPVRMLYAEFLGLVYQVEQNGMAVVQHDVTRIEEAFPRRRLELSPVEADQLASDIERAQSSLDRAETEMQRILGDVRENASILQNPALDQKQLEKNYELLNNLRERLVKVTQNLMVIQVSLRLELIRLEPFEMAMQDAVSIGIDNRVDLMNARALVMDARRKVEVAANALLANLSVVVDGDVNTPVGNKPFDFRGSQSQLRAGLAFTAPLDQIDERNAYRVTQINYQRQRRAYMLAEDNVKADIREAWRQLFVLRQNMETSRRAVRLAALQYDSAVEQSNAPVAVGSSSSRGSGVAGTNLQQALSNLLSAQNQLIQIWVSYERNRLNIYLDMGIMEIGEDGMWIDPFYGSLKNANDASQIEPLRSTVDVGSHVDRAPRVGRSSMGTGTDGTGLVALPGTGGIIQAGAEAPDAGFSQEGSLPDQPERAGFSGQSQKRLPDQPRRRDDNDYQYRARGDVGDAGRSRL